MRLPWLSIDADGQTRGRLLGRLLGIRETDGIGIAIALWTWALEMSPEGDFSGNVPGDAVLLAAAVSWPSDDTQRLVDQMQRVGFVATTPTLRVRGLDRYRATWEKNRRRGHGKDNHPNSGDTRAGSPRGPRVSRENPERKTETETETEKKDFLASGPQLPPKKPRKLSAAEEFFAWLTARRSERTKHTDAAHTVVAVNAIFGRALVAVGRPALERAYLAYLDEPDGASQEPPWPWRGFAARYASLARRAAATPKTESMSL